MGTRDTSVFGPRRSLRRAEYPADRQERAPSSEQREARRETVQEVPPADRSDLAGAERARRRDRTEELVDEARVVVGDAEEVTAPAVAREQQRGTGVDTTEHLAQVLVGGGRVPYVELHRLADRHTIADRERTRLLVRAEHVPDEEVAAGELGLVLVDDEAHVQATAEQLAFVVADARGELLEPRDRRPAAELLDEVPLRTRDHERVADRPATLRDDRVDGDAFEEDADRAVGEHRLVEREAVGTRPAAGRRESADDGEAGPVLVEATEEAVDGERERLREEQQGRRVAVEHGPARDRGAVERLLDAQRDRRQARVGEHRGEDRQRGRLLVLVGAADHRDRGPAEEDPGAEQLAHRAGHVLEGADEVRRREA